MSSTDKLVRDLTKAIKNLQTKKTSAYDTQAEVLRVEGGTAWVHIPGGADETPVRLTVDAQEGDTVRNWPLRSGGGLTLTSTTTSRTPSRPACTSVSTTTPRL